MNTTSLSEDIASIYRNANDYDLESFRTFCFQVLEKHIPYQAGIWLTRRESESALTWNDTYLYQLPNDFMQNYNDKVSQKLIGEDPLGAVTIANPNLPVTTFDAFDSQEQYHQSTTYIHHCKVYGIEDAICMLVMPTAQSHFSIISLYKINNDVVFTLEQLKFVKLFLPHFVEALRINMLASFNRGWRHRNSYRAITDTQGYILEAEEPFVKLMTKKNKLDFVKLNLPSLTHDLPVKFSQNAFLFEATLQQKVVFVELLNQANTDRTLTPRQQQVADLVCDGLDNKEIALQLNISVNTVSNHLKRIYEIIGVTSRSGLTAYVFKKNNQDLTR